MSTPYLVSYDLNKSGKDYKSFYDEIDKQCKAWCKPLRSVYLVRSDLSVNELSDKLKAVIDNDDFLLVIEVRNNKQGWLSEKNWEYINKKIFI